MSFKQYRTPRMVVLDLNSSVLEAARAMESNDVGAMVFQNKGRIAGIVTDRDLAIRVLGRGLDPKATAVTEVMTTPVATLAPEDCLNDAIRLMRQRKIRHIPLVEDEQVVGIVMLEDLVVDETTPIDELAAVIVAQISAGGLPATLRTPSARRSAAKSQATRGRDRLACVGYRGSTDRRETALEMLLGSIIGARPRTKRLPTRTAGWNSRSRHTIDCPK